MNKAIVNDDRETKKLERQHMRKKRKSTYIALEEIDHNWDRWQVELFDQYWEEGKSLEELSDLLFRNQGEVLALILDRAMKDKIKPRKGGLFGYGM